MKTIFMDMDGTIANLYGYPCWLDYIHNDDVTPYEECSIMVEVPKLRNAIHYANRNNVRVKIVSWNCGGDISKTTLEKIEYAKRLWLDKYKIVVDDVLIMPYGTPKYEYASDGDILIDDNFDNRDGWVHNVKNGHAYDAINVCDTIINVVKRMINNVDD